MRRGDVVIVSAPGSFGKPRPAVVIQNSRLERLLSSVIVCFMTTDGEQTHHLRILIEPSQENNLRETSHVQTDKIMTFPTDKVRGPIGRLTDGQMMAIDRGLLAILDLLPPIFSMQRNLSDER
jgi:mRNA interferase MazF